MDLFLYGMNSVDPSEAGDQYLCAQRQPKWPIDGQSSCVKKLAYLIMMLATPSILNYKSFQESWRVKLFQSLTKIIERNTKIYDIK